MLFFEYKLIHSKPSCRYNSLSQIYLLISKIILSFLYEFLSNDNNVEGNHNIILALVTFIISLFLLVTFYNLQPFYNQKVNCLHLCKYFLFFWGNASLLITICLKGTNFTGGLGIFYIGCPVIVFGCFCRFWKVESDLAIKNDELITNGYQMLKRIQLFLTTIEGSDVENFRKEQVILLGYLQEKEESSSINNMILRQINQVQSEKGKEKKELYNERKCFLLQYIDHLYKESLKRFPSYLQLRISYGMFLFKKNNKKHQALSEIEYGMHYAKSFEEEYLCYICKKYFEEELFDSSSHKDNVDYVSAIAYKGYITTFKSLVIKVSLFYIDFWSLLLSYDNADEQNNNLIKMNELGKKIQQTVLEINETFQKINKINSNEPDVLQIYSQFLSEVLNDQKQSKEYQNKLIELNKKKIKYDENNLYTLNFKSLSQSEEYQYIITSAKPEDFGTITNISLAVCLLLGFVREEIIGQKIDVLIPEILHEEHNEMMKRHLRDFKKKLFFSELKENDSENSENHVHYNFINDACVFAVNKAKYLIKLKLKIGIVCNEEGDNYFIAQVILDSKTNWDNIENKVSYIITDIDFNIQNFCLSAIKMLNLNSSSISNSVNVTDFIKEFNEDMLYYLSNDETGEHFTHKRQVKTHVLNKGYRNAREITWILNENIDLGNLKWRGRRYTSMLGRTSLDVTNIPADRNKDTLMNNSLLKYEKPNLFLSSIKFQKRDQFKFIRTSTILFPDTNLNKSSFMNTEHGYDLEKTQKKFLLKVDDIFINKKQFGYVFTFEMPKQNLSSNKHYSATKITQIKEICEDSVTPKNYEIKPLNEKESQLFQSTLPGNENQLMNLIHNRKEEQFTSELLSNNYVPQLHEGTSFNLNLDRMAFIQHDNEDNNELRTQLRDIALAKIHQTIGNHNEIEEEEESELEKESFTNGESGEVSSSKLSSSNISSFVEKEENIVSPKYKSKTIQNYKNKFNSFNLFNNTYNTENYLNQYYKVDLSHVRYFMYDFEKGIVEEIKLFQKLSEIDIRTKNIEEGVDESKLSPKMNKQNTSNEKNTSNSIDDSILDWDIASNKKVSSNEMNIIINQIEKALNNKTAESEVNLLFFISVCVFGVLIIITVISLELYNDSKNNIVIYLDLIIQSNEYLQALMFSVFSVRELILLTHEGYTNIYEPNKTMYIQEMYNKANEYFLQNSEIVDHLNSILNNLPIEERNELQSLQVKITILSDKRFIKTYYLSMENALIENTVALYHISLLNFTDIISLHEDVFYFLKNSLNSVLIASEEQVDIFLKYFLKQTKSIRIKYVTILFVIVIIYIIVFCLFIYFLIQVKHKEESYLAIFYEINHSFIEFSLSKCERFSQKIQNENNNLSEHKNTISIFSSSFNEHMEVKQTNMNKDNAGIYLEKKNKKRNTKNKFSHIKIILLFLMIFLFLCLYHCIMYIVALILTYKYDNFSHFIVSYFAYQNKYLLLFIFIRELIYDHKRTLRGVDIYSSVREGILSFYDTIATQKNNMKYYFQYLPNDFKSYYEYITNCNLCQDSEIEIAKNLSSINVNCSEFLHSSLSFGMNYLLNSFIEEVRLAKNYYDSFRKISDKEGIIHNYTLIGSKYYDELLPKDNITKYEIFNKTEPMMIYNMTLHKNLIIINTFVFKPIFRMVSGKMEMSINNCIKFYSMIVYILICLFLGIVIVMYLFFVVPFQYNLSETIYKSKNMLSIIPKEVLGTLPQVKKILGINKQTQQGK